MSRIKNLVILVADYPNGTGEPFLEDEIKILEKDFDKIYLLHTNPNQIINKTFELYTPVNSQIFDLYTQEHKVSVFSKIFHIFRFRFIYEVLLARFKHKIKWSIQLVKLISNYWISSGTGALAIEEFIESEKIDLQDTVFYSYWCDSHAISLARIKTKKPFLKFVTRLHGWDLYFGRHEANFLPFREFIFNNAEKIMPISNDGRAYLLKRKLSIRPEKIITSRLGVEDFDINVRYKETSIAKDSDGTCTILTLSHINPVKRLDRIVELLKSVKEFNIVWHHIGYGFEPYQTQLKDLVEKDLAVCANIKFQFHGQFTKSEVKTFLETTPIDCIINCSDTEGIPVSLMEANSAGIPSIAFDVGGVPGVVSDQINGFLIPFNNQQNTDNLKNALIAFYNLPKEAKQQFSVNAKRIWREEFNKDSNFKKVSCILKGIEDQCTTILACKKCLISNEIYPSIVLDKYGVCDVCKVVEAKNKKIQKQRDEHYLENLLKEIRTRKKDTKYDCILGISGGVDSAYLALKAKEWGLNPLLVHIDNGWNSETAVYNIQTLIKQLDFDLYTVVFDWEEIKDLVRSFLKASVIDVDWANEMCAQASLYKVAKKFGVKHILTGHQMATEGWMPDNVVHYKLDTLNFHSIHKQFGEVKLKKYETIGFLKTFYYEKILKLRYYFPLDYIEYNKEKVKEELVQKYGWKDYGQKHFESIFTRFYQGHILIKKFKIDKRRFHYSSSILSGQLTKEQAIELLNSNEYSESGQLEEDKEYIIKKLEFTPQEFENILNEAPKSHGDYPSIINVLKKLKRIKNVIQNNK